MFNLKILCGNFILEHLLKKVKKKYKKGDVFLFFEKIEKYCSDNKLSIMAFEQKCGLSNGSVSKWKDGGFPSIPTLQKIEKATKIPIKKWLS